MFSLCWDMTLVRYVLRGLPNALLASHVVVSQMKEVCAEIR